MSLFSRVNKLPIHPFLISSFTGLVLYTSNVAHIPAQSTYNAFALIILGCVVLLTLLWALFKDLQKAAVLCSLFFVLFFSYSDLYNYANLQIAGFSLQRQLIIFPVFVTILISASLFIVRLKPAAISAIHSILNLSSIALFLFPVLQLWNHYNQPVILPQAPGLATHLDKTDDARAATYPDIVYLILDGYGRHDILKRYYGFDNSHFINFMKDQGFYIANRSTSNYCYTLLSLTSSLNLNYVQTLLSVEKEPGLATEDLSSLVESALLISFLKKHDYQIKSFSSGYTPIEMEINSEVLSPYQLPSDFSYILLNKTPFLIISQNPFLSQLYSKVAGTFITPINPYLAHQDRILFTLANLPSALEPAKPSFIFADILAGHPPFVFSEDGKRIQPPRAYSLADGSHFLDQEQASIEEYRNGYRAQVSFLNERLMQMLEELLTNRERPLIVVIQGDHGPGSTHNGDDITKTNFEERFSILNAIYFSDRDTANLYPDITPVNTFRIIINKVFNKSLPLLEDENYYSTYTQFGDFERVTDRVQ